MSYPQTAELLLKPYRKPRQIFRQPLDFILKYQLSLIAGSILFNDTLKTASLYLQLKDWQAVKNEILNENALQKKKVATRVRQSREIIKRLRNLNSPQLDLLANSDPDTSKLIILLAIAKTYRLIYEFINEVVCAKWVLFDYTLLGSDYERFVQAKYELHPELENLTDSSKAKIKQVIFRTLAEAGLLDSVKSKRIIQPYVSENLLEVVAQDNPAYLKIFLLSDTDIERHKSRTETCEA